MGQAASLQKEGYDLDIAKEVLTAMRQHGITVSTPYCIKWESPIRGVTWYEYAKPQMPAIYDGLGMYLKDKGEVPARIN